MRKIYKALVIGSGAAAYGCADWLYREGVTDIKSSFPVNVCGDICKITVSGNGKTEFYLEYTAAGEQK